MTDQTSKKLTNEQIAGFNLAISTALSRHSGGEDKLAWIQSHPLFDDRLQEWLDFMAVDHEHYISINQGSVWKTIDLRKPFDLDDERFRISSDARDIIIKPYDFPRSGENCDVDLFLTTPRQLGFGKKAWARAIIKEGLRNGLGYCPKPTGLQLRFQYLYQPMGQELYIVSEPLTLIREQGGNVDCIFVVENDGDLMLWAYYLPREEMEPDTTLVFQRPRPKK